MSSSEGTCARTRGWSSEDGFYRKVKKKTSLIDDGISADSDTEKSEMWSELQASSNGCISDPSSIENAAQAAKGGIGEDQRWLGEGDDEIGSDAIKVEFARTVERPDLPQQRDSRLHSSEASRKDGKSGKLDGEKNHKEVDNTDANVVSKEKKSSHGKQKDNSTRNERDRTKESKKKDDETKERRTKDKHSERVENAKKEGKRKGEEISEKKSHKQHRKSERSEKAHKGDGKSVDDHSHRRDRDWDALKENHAKAHNRGEKGKESRRAKYDDMSEDEQSQRRERHRDSSKLHHSKASSKTERERDSKRARLDADQKQKGRPSSRSPRSRKRHSSSHAKEHGRSPSPRHKERQEWERAERDRNEEGGSISSHFDNRYRRYGGGMSGLGGYSPRRRRSDAAIKTPSPPARSPERRKSRAWDLPPPGMDSSMVAAMAAAQQAVAQQAAALASAVPIVSVSSLSSNATTFTSSTNPPTNVLMPSLFPQVNPAVTAVTLTQATRPVRRLYIGNVPSTVSDGELMEFMNAAMLSANANYLPGTKPCINCLVNVEKNYAFAEFLTPEDATAAIAFDGVTLHGTTLKIRRPKDFVPPVNGGADKFSTAVDMVSSIVVDSCRKIFVGGICSSLSSDKVKEIVTAFGQLKAYHWEVSTKKGCREAFAFLEYMDPTVTLKACAGLNGMRLGNNILTVVQATPDALSEGKDTVSPFYGIPEQAKTLLENPTRILEFQNVITEEELFAMSELDFEEVTEDVRLECQRFGTVKSIHILRPKDIPSERAMSSVITAEELCKELGSHIETANEEQHEKNVCDGDIAWNRVTQVDTEKNKANTENAVSELDTQNGVMESIAAARLNDGLERMPVENQALSNNQVLEAVKEVRQQKTEYKDLESTEVKHEVEPIEHTDNKFSVNGDCAKESVSAFVQNDMASKVNLPDDQVANLMSDNDFLVTDIHDASVKLKSSTLVSREHKLGRIYVEFSREEFACQAAHTLHGRMYGGRKVVVSYFPLKLYQKKFQKGLEPQTVEEKQAFALAIQEHLNEYIKDS